MKKYIHKLISFLLFTSLLLTSVVSAEPTPNEIRVDFNQIHIVVNHVEIKGNNFLYNNTTYVPLREIAEMFGKEVAWMSETKTANIKDSEKVSPTASNNDQNAQTNQQSKILVTFNDIHIQVNGVSVDADNILYNATTYVPLRKIAELLNKEVNWLGSTKTANIDDKKPLTVNEKTASDYINMLIEGKSAEVYAKFDDKMKTAITLDNFKKGWVSITTQFGALKQQKQFRTEKSDSYEIIFVTCEFERSNLDFKIVFNTEGQLVGFSIVPSTDVTAAAATPPASCKEEDITVKTGDISLPGTLTTPNEGAPFPVVILVHGSGPSDRDETIGANKPFRDLAWGLASNGIAVLRYEKRTKVLGEKSEIKTVKEEVLDDVLSAVSLLRTNAKIDSSKIFVLGHSMGGMLVPRIATLEKNIAGFIIMAGPTRPLEDLILEQTTYLCSEDGTVNDQEKTYIDQIKASVQKIKNIDQANPTEPILNAPVTYWKDLQNYKPSETAKSIEKPMFILQGERDYQVTMVDFEGWKKDLSTKFNVTFKSYPGLNHLFITGEKKSYPAEYNQPGHVSENVITDVASWVKSK